MNADAGTGTPGLFVSKFERKTLDCGVAERKVFKLLAERRRGKWGQEYFEIEIADAKRVIEICCARVDEETAQRRADERDAQLAIAAAEATVPSANVSPSSPTSRVNTSNALPTTQNASPRTALLDRVELWHLAVVGILAIWLTSRYFSAPPPAIQYSKVAPAFTNPKLTLANSTGPSSVDDDDVPNAISDKRTYRGPEEIDAPNVFPESWPNAEDVAAIENACSSGDFGNSDADHDTCVIQERNELLANPRNAQLGTLDPEPRKQLMEACLFQRRSLGLEAENICINRGRLDLAAYPRGPSETEEDEADRDWILRYCSTALVESGPGAFNRCAFGAIYDLANEKIH